MMTRSRSSQAWRWEAIDAFKNKYYSRTLSTKGQRYQKGARLGPLPPYAKEWPRERPVWPAAVALKMVDLLMFLPDEIWMVKAKMHPHAKDILMLEEYARLIPLTSLAYLDGHRHKPVRKFVIYAEGDPEVIRRARAEGITVYLFEEGRFIDV